MALETNIPRAIFLAALSQSHMGVTYFSKTIFLVPITLLFTTRW